MTVEGRGLSQTLLAVASVSGGYLLCRATSAVRGGRSPFESPQRPLYVASDPPFPYGALKDRAHLGHFPVLASTLSFEFWTKFRPSLFL